MSTTKKHKTIKIGNKHILTKPDGTVVTTPAAPQPNNVPKNVSLAEVALEQSFNFNCHGLRPNTQHKFFFAGIDLTPFCKQYGKQFGGGLQTDKNGKLSFRFLHAAVVRTVNVTTAVAWEQAKSLFTSAVQVQVVSTDGQSLAQFTLKSSQVKALGGWNDLWKGTART